MVVVKVQGDCPSQPSQGQLLADAGGQVIAVDGVVGGVENELVLLCKNSECLVQVSLALFSDSKGNKHIFSYPLLHVLAPQLREAKGLCLSGIRVVRMC